MENLLIKVNLRYVYSSACSHLHSQCFWLITWTLQEISCNVSWGWFVVISNFHYHMNEQEWCSNWCLLLWRNGGTHTRIHQLKCHAVILPKIVEQENQKEFKLFIVLVKLQEFELIFQWLVRVFPSLWISMR